MAIGVEQLDIKNIAKIFLLKDQLGSEIASDDFKEYIKLALESFTEEDWDKIRENIFPSSDEKKALREAIDGVKELLEVSEIGIREGQYSELSVNVLTNAVKNAESAIRTQKDETVEERELMLIARALLLNAKDRFLKSVITEDGYMIDNVWYGSKRLIGGSTVANGVVTKTKWVPAKVINEKYYISLEEIPAGYFGRTLLTHIRGLWLIIDGKEVVITREVLPASLGIEVIEGVILNDYLYAAEEDLALAPYISDYLGKPINIAPCRFNSSTVLNDTTAYLQYTPNFADIFANITGAQARDIFKVNGESAIRLTNIVSDSKSYLSAKPNSGILVDNINKVITGVGTFTADLAEEVQTKLCAADGADILVDIEFENDSINEQPDVIGLTMSVRSKDGKSISTFTLCEDLVVVDVNADIINGKCYSKNHPVDKKLEWIPTFIIDNKYYVSPEPIDENNVIYKENKDLVHIVGILDEQNGIIFTRHDLSNHELTNPNGKYRLNVVNGGYYNGYWFGDNSGDASQLSKYIKYMPIFRKQNFGEGCAVGFVKSEFVEYNTSNTTPIEPEFYWVGKEEDVIKLPDKRSLCKFYLNIIAIRATAE